MAKVHLERLSFPPGEISPFIRLITLENGNATILEKCVFSDKMTVKFPEKIE